MQAEEQPSSQCAQHCSAGQSSSESAQVSHAGGADYVTTYYPMQWDSSSLGKNITLKEDDFTALHATSNWNTVCARCWLSEGIHEIELATECVDNISLFVGVVERKFCEEQSNAEEGDEVLPRDSKHAICMHGDGRVFIRGAEKDWGLMRVSTGDPILITLDFARGLVIFKLTRTVRGKERETIAEIPGLRQGEVTIMACFGGRDQELRLARHDVLKQPRGAAIKKVRDAFAEAMGQERVAPVPFSAPSKAGTYEEQIRDMAATMETSM